MIYKSDTLLNLSIHYRVSTKKVHFSTPDSKVRVNFFVDTLYILKMGGGRDRTLNMHNL